jgi:hypothetical protein
VQASADWLDKPTRRPPPPTLSPTVRSRTGTAGNTNVVLVRIREEKERVIQSGTRVTPRLVRCSAAPARFHDRGFKRARNEYKYASKYYQAMVSSGQDRRNLQLGKSTLLETVRGPLFDLVVVLVRSVKVLRLVTSRLRLFTGKSAEVVLISH